MRFSPVLQSRPGATTTFTSPRSPTRCTPRLIVEIAIRMVVLGVAFCLIWFGYINYLRGFGSFRLPSGTPIASLYAVIPLAGVLIALFSIEQLVNGIVNGFDHPEPRGDASEIQRRATALEGRTRL